MEIRSVEDMKEIIGSILGDEPMNLKSDDHVSIKTYDNHIEIRKVKIEEL